MAMNTSTKYTIMVVLVLGLGLAAYFLGGRGGDNNALNERTVESINWEKTYDSKSKLIDIGTEKSLKNAQKIFNSIS